MHEAYVSNPSISTFSSVQVPCYSYGQKLSKLAILRIACNYILSLAQLAEQDDGADCSSHSFTQCVEQCTRTLQAEGRSKKRKVMNNKNVFVLFKKMHYSLTCVVFFFFFRSEFEVDSKVAKFSGKALVMFEFFESCSTLLTLFKCIVSLYNS